MRLLFKQRFFSWFDSYDIYNEAGETVREAVPLETGDYGRVYDALYETLVNGQPNYVKETDVLTNMEILQRGFEQPSPATITLTR